MTLKVEWKEEDQESKQKDRSRAKITELKVGNKMVMSPLRGAKVFKSTSDFSSWLDVTGKLLYPKTIAMMHMGVYPETVENLTVSNGKFNGKVTDFSSYLGTIDNTAIKMVYPRISLKRATEIPLTRETLRAFLQYLNTVEGNDANILPLPPLQRTIQKFDTVIKGAIEDSYPSFATGKPLVGYIPGFDNPLHAAELAEKYVSLDQDVSMFIIDFATTKRHRTAFEVISRLYDLRKKEEIGDFYIHAVNVPKDTRRGAVSPFYDLTLPVEGIDSFVDIVFPIGGGKPGKGETPLDYNKRKRYSLASQYGSFSYAELKARKLIDEICNGPVCKGANLETLYKTKDYKRFAKILSTHRLFLEMFELDEFGKTMRESSSILDYIRERPMAEPVVNELMRDIT